MKTLQQRIEDSIRRNPLHSDGRIAKNVKTLAGEVARVRGTMTLGDPPPVRADLDNISGVSLDGRKILPRKPTDNASHLIQKLPLNRGFEIATLSQNWGLGEETIRRYAKNMKCLKFVEVDGEWLPMVINPKTAESLNV